MNIMVGGEAGQGVQSVGMILAKTMARGGLHIFADQDYESRVRGGHNFFRIRVIAGLRDFPEDFHALVGQLRARFSAQFLEAGHSLFYILFWHFHG